MTLIPRAFSGTDAIFEGTLRQNRLLNAQPVTERCKPVVQNTTGCKSRLINYSERVYTETEMSVCVDRAVCKVRKAEGSGVDMMEWINVFGAVFIVVIMVPNIVYAVKCRDGFENKWSNKGVEIAEQIGRFGCFGFMVVNIPGTWFGWWSDEAFALYLIGNTVLIILYCVIWIICFRKNTVFKALALSGIPAVIFLFSGIMSRSVLLIVASLLFAPAHILISYKNAT